jgi:uncharacterized membrane protein YwzB
VPVCRCLPSGPVKETLRLSFQPSVVKRSIKFAVVVGAVLISINHGDAILEGTVSRRRVFQMLLTIVVPYTVSTLSSVQAIRQISARQSGAGAGAMKPVSSP